MPKPSTSTSGRTDDEDSRPLLGSTEDDHSGNSIPKDVVFEADEDEDEDGSYEHIGDDTANYPRSGPPLKSTIQSREARQSHDAMCSEAVPLTRCRNTFSFVPSDRIRP